MRHFLKKNILFIFIFIFLLLFPSFVLSLNATLNYPLNNTLLNPYENSIYLNATLYLSNGADGTLYFINYSNNEIICYNASILNETPVSCLIYLSQGENLIWQVNISDESANLTIGNWNFSIAINNPVLLKHLSYSPLEPNITKNITFNIIAEDDFNQSFILEYFIYNQSYFMQNDLLFSGNISIQNNTFVTIKNLTTSYLKKGSLFNLTIRFFDTEYTAFNSTILEIQDSLPDFFAEINSTEIYTINKFRNDSILIGYCIANDLDNDNYTITARWYKNNEPYLYINPYYIALGFDFTCTQNYCWGNNDYGQLGDGSLESKNYPSQINITYKFKEISAGLQHACGIIENGTLYCWGNNDYGQLGIGSYEETKNPVPVNLSHKFLKISSGDLHTCGIIENGTLYCWGNNNYGQLGIGYVNLNLTNLTNPFPVNSSFQFKDISSGFLFTCGILINGSVYCWGNGFKGKLGNGQESNYYSPTSVNISARFLQISSGKDHTCGILINGSVYCWGNNEFGELGYITETSNSSNPKPINFSNAFKLISAGNNFTCGLLLNNSAYCWGNNDYGQLGNSSFTSSYYPVFVNASPMHFIKSGTRHVCGILLNKTPLCWGRGLDGELGNNENSDSENPVFVDLIPDFFENQNINNLTNSISFGSNYNLECFFYNQTHFVGSLNSSQREILFPNLEIYFYYPENNTLINMSYAIPLIFEINELSKCKFSIDNGNFYYLSNSSYMTNFTGNFSIYTNTGHNLTLNCTDYYGISKLFKLNITINDNTAPVITIIKKETLTTSINITFSTNEPSNWTFILINQTTMYFPNFANKSSARFTDLEQGVTYYFNITACDQLRNCGSILDSAVTDKISNTSSGSTDSSSTTAGQTTKFTQQWLSPSVGQYLMNIPNSEIAITNIIFDIENNLTGSLLISIEKISLPDTISILDNSYQYLKIEKNSGNLSNIKIKFQVLNKWIDDNNINPENVSLYRYNTNLKKWDKLHTRNINKDANYNYYESDTPGFSYFAIKGEILAQDNIIVQENSQPSENQITPQITQEINQLDEDNEEYPQVFNNKSKQKNKNFNISFIIFPVFILLVIGSVFGFIFYQRKQSLIADKDLSELTNYVQRCKAQSIENSAIKNTLLKVGWPEYLVDLALYEIHIPSRNIDKLKNYIKEMRKTKKDDEIKESLKKVGWTEEAITTAFKNF